MQACNEAYPISGYILDMKNLMEAWKKISPDHKFAGFKKVWSERSFSYIHAAKPDALTGAKWAQVLYETAFGYLFVSDLHIKIGSIYAAFMLFMTQPKLKKHKIHMSIALWREIFDVMESSKTILPDVLAVVAKLQEHKAYLLSASVSIIPPPTVVPEYDPRDEFAKKFFTNGKLNLDTVGENVLDFAALEAIDAKYQALLGNNTSIVSKDLLETLHTIKQSAHLRIDQTDGQLLEDASSAPP